jgi:hypothetical protein
VKASPTEVQLRGSLGGRGMEKQTPLPPSTTKKLATSLTFARGCV